MSLEELIRACAENGDAGAWEEFVRRFHSLIAAVVLRTARRWGSNSPELVDDLIQDTYLKICSQRELLLREFTPRHPEAFYGYLKVVTSNVVHDYFRARHSQKRGLGIAESSVDDVEFMRKALTGSPNEDVHRNILLKEVDEILRSVLSGDNQTQTRDRTVFWLYYRYGLTAPAIARLPSISLKLKGVESVIHRLTRLVRERLTPPDEAVN